MPVNDNEISEDNTQIDDSKEMEKATIDAWERLHSVLLYAITEVKALNTITAKPNMHRQAYNEQKISTKKKEATSTDDEEVKSYGITKSRSGHLSKIFVRCRICF
jgi:hypothetical protein